MNLNRTDTDIPEDMVSVCFDWFLSGKFPFGQLYIFCFFDFFYF